LLKELNPQKASGPDGISAIILKECAKDIADALILLFTDNVINSKQIQYYLTSVKRSIKYVIVNY